MNGRKEAEVQCSRKTMLSSFPYQLLFPMTLHHYIQFGDALFWQIVHLFGQFRKIFIRLAEERQRDKHTITLQKLELHHTIHTISCGLLEFLNKIIQELAQRARDILHVRDTIHVMILCVVHLLHTLQGLFLQGRQLEEKRVIISRLITETL